MKILDQIWKISCEILSTSSAATELIYGIMLQLGVDPQTITERIERGHSFVEVFLPSQTQAKTVTVQLRRLKLKGIKLRLTKIQKADWQDKWKKGIKPFALTQSLEIVPRWTSARRRNHERFPIYIDTNLAFGTGLHETTRFMAQIMEDRRDQFETFLDVGTGSGILAIAARYYGAKKITAIDIDPQSIPVAKENLAANGVLGVKVFAKDFAKWNSRKTFDFVAANLVTMDLVEFGERLARRVKAGKYLAVSGISLANLPRLRKEFAKLPLKLVKVVKGREWAAVLYIKVS